MQAILLGVKRWSNCSAIVILAVSSLIVVKPEHASAQITTPTPPPVTPSSNPASTPTPTPTPPAPTPTPTPPYPKPLIPEFTVKLISSLTEANETKIELTIKNQPFDRNNIYNYSFVYNVRIRTNDENWTDLYDAEDGYPTQSNSDYTVLSYVLGESAYYPPADYPLSSQYEGWYTSDQWASRFSSRGNDWVPRQRRLCQTGLCRMCLRAKKAVGATHKH